MSKVRKKAVSMKLEFSSIRQKKAGGPYYYRYQLNGQRKEIPLQTDNKEEAEKKAKALVPITQAKSIEVVAAHVSQARGFEMQTQKLLLSEA